MAEALELAKAYVQIVPTSENLASGIHQMFDPAVQSESEAAGQTSGSKFSAAFGSFMKTAGAVSVAAVSAAAAGITALTKQAYTAFGDYEQLSGGVETLFKESADRVMNYANQAYETAGLSANQYMETVTSFSASLLQSLDGDTAQAATLSNQAIIDMADNANKMGTSMEMIQNAYSGFAKQNYTMLDNLKLGYGGTKSEMERLLADAQAISGIEYDISSYADVINAIHTIQEEMGVAGTTAKEASTTLQGSANLVKGAWENLISGLGQNTAIAPLVDNLVNSVQTLLDNAFPVITKIISRLAPAISEMVPKIATSLITVVSQTAPTLITAALKLVESFGTILRENLGTLLQTGFDIIFQICDGIISALPELLPAVVSMIVEIANLVLDNVDKVVDIAINLVMALVDGLFKAIPILLEALPGLIQKVITVTLTNAAKLINAVVELLLKIVDGLPDIINDIIEVLPVLITGIITALLENTPQLVSAGITLFVALVENLPQIVIEIVKAVPAIIQGLIDAFNDSQVDMETAGVALFESLVNDIVTAATTIGKDIEAIWNAIKAKLEEWIPKIKEAGYNLLIALVDKIEDIKKSIKTKIDDLIEKMKNAFTNAVDKFKEIGKNIVEGIWNGISGAWDGMVEDVKGLAGSLVDSIKKKLKINSPSKVFGEIGAYCVEGFDNAFSSFGDGAMDSIQNTMNDLSKLSSTGLNVSGTYVNGSETSMYNLLAQYLPALLEKESVQLSTETNEDALFKVVQRKAKVYTKATRQPAFGR